MSVKVTVPNTSSDSVVFGSANTPTAAEVVGIDSGSSNGQLAFKTTASGTSTERMRIDASGNVGIGVTPNGTYKLQLGSTNLYPVLISSSNTNATAFVVGNTNSRSWEFAVGGSANAISVGGLYLFDQSAGSARLIIDTNGIVTKPYQPSFTGWRTAGNVSATNVILHNNIITNVGSYYNASTGRFTCPVAGKYLVICDGHSENTNPHEHAIYKNGSAVCYAYENGATYGRSTQSAILDCAANDYIQHYVTNGTFWGGNNSGLKMTITLIG